MLIYSVILEYEIIYTHIYIYYTVDSQEMMHVHSGHEVNNKSWCMQTFHLMLETPFDHDLTMTLLNVYFSLLYKNVRWWILSVYSLFGSTVNRLLFLWCISDAVAVEGVCCPWWSIHVSLRTELRPVLLKHTSNHRCCQINQNTQNKITTVFYI